MSRKKQIEEMAEIACNATNPELKRGCTRCPFNKMCDIQESCEALYNAGYRKQSEGKWIQHTEKPTWLEDDVEVFYECSICNTQSPAPTNFCPNCGAKMKGGAE